MSNSSWPTEPFLSFLQFFFFFFVAFFRQDAHTAFSLTGIVHGRGIVDVGRIQSALKMCQSFLEVQHCQVGIIRTMCSFLCWVLLLCYSRTSKDLFQQCRGTDAIIGVSSLDADVSSRQDVLLICFDLES